MEVTHKKVLLRFRNELVGESGIEMTDDFSTALNMCTLFPKTWLDKFQVLEWSNEQKVLKMLDLLPKRGPDAFHKFVRVLQDDYPWWSTRLREAAESAAEDGDGEVFSNWPAAGGSHTPDSADINLNDIGNELERIQQENEALRQENERLRRFSLSSNEDNVFDDDTQALREEVNTLKEDILEHPRKMSEALYDEFRMNEMWERLRRRTGRH